MGDGGMNKKAVCLCSGGLDSTIAATIARNQGYQIHMFHVNYGQKAQEREKVAVMQVAEALGASEVKIVDVMMYRDLSDLTSSRPIPVGTEVDMAAAATPSTWVSCRNLVFVSLAAAYGEYLDAKSIYVGFNAEEGRSYPDNRPEFVERFNHLLERSVASFSKPPRIEAPLVDLFKPDIVRLGLSCGAPVQLTWSCYMEGDIHCGICESCQHRRRGFVAAGVTDPTLYER